MRHRDPLLLAFALMGGCRLFPDATIEETCDELVLPRQAALGGRVEVVGGGVVGERADGGRAGGERAWWRDEGPTYPPGADRRVSTSPSLPNGRDSPEGTKGQRGLTAPPHTFSSERQHQPLDFSRRAMPLRAGAA